MCCSSHISILLSVLSPLQHHFITSPPLFFNVMRNLCWNDYKQLPLWKAPSSLQWHISALSPHSFHPCSSRDRDCMSWHGKSHLSLNCNTLQPSITAWAECCDPNWSLSGGFTFTRPPSLRLRLLCPFNTRRPSSSGVYFCEWVCRGTVTRVWCSSCTQTKGHREGYYD